MKSHVKNLLSVLRPVFGRFPAVTALGAVFAACACFVICRLFRWDADSDDLNRFPFAMLLSAPWTMVLAFVVQLASERAPRLQRTAAHLGLHGALVLSALVPGQLLCRRLIDDAATPRLYAMYGFSLLCLLSLCPFFLRGTQHDDEIVPNIIISAVFAGILAACLSTAGSIVLLAVSFLFGTESAEAYICLWIIAFSVVGVACFTSYVTRPHGQLAIPAFYRGLCTYVLLPLYAVLLGVLYVYLAKCVVTRSVPLREANVFASLASALYLLLRLNVAAFKNGATNFFCRRGALFLLPLLVLQAVISVNRIHAHGVSAARYCAVLYLVFSVAFVALALFRQGRHLLWCCPVLGALCLFAAFSPWNMIDVPVKSQQKRMERILNAHGLMQDGHVLTAQVADALSDDEKNAIVRAYDKMDGLGKQPAWFRLTMENGRSTTFQTTFGFAKRQYGAAGGIALGIWYSFRVRENPADAVDIAPQGVLYPIRWAEPDAAGPLAVQFADRTLDLTEAVLELLLETTPGLPQGNVDVEFERDEPLVFQAEGGYTVYVTYADFSFLVGDIAPEQTEQALRDRLLSKSHPSLRIHGFAVR